MYKLTNSLLLQVLFPSGAKVAIFRNYWGIDVNVYTPRAENISNEMGLCLYDGIQDVNKYGNNLRYKNIIKEDKFTEIFETRTNGTEISRKIFSKI